MNECARMLYCDHGEKNLYVVKTDGMILKTCGFEEEIALAKHHRIIKRDEEPFIDDKGQEWIPVSYNGQVYLTKEMHKAKKKKW